MLDFEKAFKMVINDVPFAGTESVPLESSLGRVTAESIQSDVDMPPFNKSAMDGYAYSSNDDSDEFSVIEIIQAGASPRKSISVGECSKIMTGAEVPPGADRVIRVEFTSETDGRMNIEQAEKTPNICLKAEDVKKGNTVVTQGTLITPQVMGVLASVGCASVKTARKPLVGIIATGKEVVEPAMTPGPGQIRNSNSYQLYGQVARCSAQPRLYGIAQDEKEDIESLITAAVKECDILLLSGGVSMGDYDLVPGILKKQGADIKFEKIAVKPGKPTVFGKLGSAYVYGLPGNPVSTFVIFELLVRPLIEKMIGLKKEPFYIKGELQNDVRTKKSKRIKFVPVHIDKDCRITPVEYHGSAHLTSYISANGILRINEEGENLCKGTVVHVRQI